MKQTVLFDLSGVLLFDAQVIEEGLAFVRECLANNLAIGIISNLDSVTLSIVREKMPHLFTLFPEHHITLPHMAGVAKPSREIYEHALQKMNVEPMHCFFIDDSKVNVIAAQEYGMTAVHHTDWKATREELIICGLKLRNKQ
jgi:FMN phosphatase YigB (HAD superfamily)